MHRAFRIMSVALIVAAMGISGCVSTTFQAEWKDPTFRGTFKKVIVICLVKELSIRNTLEDNLVAQFKSRGVAAVQSYTLFPSLGNINKETVGAKVGELHADGVFLVRQTGKESMELSRAQFTGDNNVPWNELSLQTFIGTVDFYRFETSFYEATKGRIIWQALSETYDDDTLRKIVNNFALLLAKKLSEQGLI